MPDMRALFALRRYPDPAISSDPLISGLVTRLQTLPVGPAPSDTFRAELRAQLVALAPRLVAEGVGAPARDASTGTRRAGWDRVRAGLLRPLRRPLAVAGTLIVIFALLLSGAVWLSGRTLPGDTLYGLKRASENVKLSLTSGTGARGREYLDLAKKRAQEISDLLARASALAAGPGAGASGSISSRTEKLIRDTLGDADSDLRNGARLLTGQAVHDASARPLDSLSSWAPGQISRLTSITDRLPAGALHERAAESRALAERALDRATRLRADIGCGCLNSTPSDDLGPLPCPAPCSTRPAQPGKQAPTGTAPPGPGGGQQPGPGTGNPTPGAPSGAPSSAPGGPPASGGASTGTGPAGATQTTGPPPTSPPGGILPSLPLPGTSSSAPITVDSCGVTITLGSLGVGLGTCGLHL